MLSKILLVAVALGVASAQTFNVQVPQTGKITFQSVGHPGQYQNSKSYTYIITGPVGQSIQFDAEAFSLESGTYDTLKFTERVNGATVVVGSAYYSGTSGPSKIRSTTNVVTAIFTTDSSITSTGFKIAARVPICPGNQNTCPGDETHCIANNQYCDGEVHCPLDGADEKCPEGCGNQVIQPNIARFNQLIAALAKPQSEKIVGGTEAIPHSWPWQVAMLTSSGSQICGGSILDNNWIMTAAHCCVAYSAVPGSYKVRVGAHDLRSSSEANAKTLSLSRLIVHPQYVARPVAQNDFCLLKTSEPIVFSQEVSHVCLPDENGGDEAPGTKCWVTGWGSTAANRGDFAEFIKSVKAEEAGAVPKPKNTLRATPGLRQVDVVVTTEAVCKVAYPGNISPQMICAASPGKDSCQGDSGGPFVCQQPPVAGVAQPYKLAGVVSWGRGCAQANYPGVYARTSTVLDWVNGYLVGGQ